jgi:hypothetical protein
VRISLTTSGLLDPAKLSAWSQTRQASIRQAVAAGMREGGKEVVQQVRTRMQADFTVRKSAFIRSMRAKIYDRNPDKLPALLIGSKIPWLGIHARGGTLSGKMLIPLTEEGKRIGRKAFMRVIDALLRSGNAYFIKKNGKVILMAESITENATALRRFKRAQRQRTGEKRIRRGQEIPIAVLVSRVTLKRRFDLEGMVRSRVPGIVRAIETQLKNI